MAEKDPFGFGAATAEADGPSVDLEMFAPKPKAVDRSAAAAASAVAQGAGFSRRIAGPKPAKAASPAVAPAPRPAKGARRRIPLSQAVGFEDRYPDSERAQLNVLAPLPVVLRWREIVKNNNGPAWAVLEKAMDALAAQSAGGHDPAEGDR